MKDRSSKPTEAKQEKTGLTLGSRNGLESRVTLLAGRLSAGPHLAAWRRPTAREEQVTSDRLVALFLEDLFIGKLCPASPPESSHLSQLSSKMLGSAVAIRCVFMLLKSDIAKSAGAGRSQG